MFGQRSGNTQHNQTIVNHGREVERWPASQEERYAQHIMDELEPTKEPRGFKAGTLHFLAANKYGRRLTAAGLILLLHVSYYDYQDPAVASEISCNDAGHDLVKIGNTSHLFGYDKAVSAKETIRKTTNVLSLGHWDKDNRTWDDLAAMESKPSRRWQMKGAALAQANPGLARYDKHKKLIDEIDYTGSACIALPAPQIPGEQAVDGKHSVEYYWSNNSNLNWNAFTELNPGITGDKSQILQAGKVLLFSKKPATDLMYRTMTESSLGQVAHDNLKMITYIKNSQPADTKIAQGQPSYLPLLQTSYMREHNITVAAVNKEYAANYVNLGLGQVVPPKDIKPVIPPKAEHHKSPNQASVSDLQAADLMKTQGGMWVNGAVMMRFYLEHGLTPVQASAFIGNFIGEASNNPQRVQGGPDSATVPVNLCPNRGYGIGQWTSCGRVQGLIQFAADNNMPVGNLMTQLEYSWYELTHISEYKQVLAKLKLATTTWQASDIVMGPYIRNGNRSGGYENPNAKVAHQFNRRKFSGQAYSLFTQLKNDT